MSLLGFDAVGRRAITQFTVFQLATATVSSGSNLTAVPTSRYKQILSEPMQKLIFTAEISPWTLA
jgi:hypothetical protein